MQNLGSCCTQPLLSLASTK